MMLFFILKLKHCLHDRNYILFAWSEKKNQKYRPDINYVKVSLPTSSFIDRM